jgi:hypothetical protein
VKRDAGGDGFGFEGAGVFPFIHEIDPSHPQAIVIEKEFLRVVDGVSDLDSLSDISRGDFINAPFKTDSGVVIDHAFMADEKDLVQFGLGKSPNGYSFNRDVIPIDGPFSDTGVQLVMILIIEPKPEGLIEFVQADVF